MPKPKKTATKSAKTKALTAQKSVQQGTFTKRHSAARYNVHFRRPQTKELPRNPKFPRRSVPKKSNLNQFSILKHPLATESAMRKVEENNTLVFIVDRRANKTQVKAAVKKMYNLEAEKVNTLIRPDGKKKAYIRLSSNHDALDEANKIGII